MPSPNLFTQKQQVFSSVFDVEDYRGLAETNSHVGKVTEKRLSLDCFESQLLDSWSLVTKTLGFQKAFEKYGSLEPKKRLVDSKFKNALQLILLSKVDSISSHENADIVAWLSSQVRQHYVNYTLPTILQVKNHVSLEHELFHSIEILETARRLYEYKILLIKQQMDVVSPGVSVPVVSKFRRDLDAIISNTVMGAISNPLTKVLNRYIAIILRLPFLDEKSSNLEHLENSSEEGAEEALLKLVNSLKNVGLTGEGFQIIFAEVMNNAMSSFIHGICQETISLKTTGTTIGFLREEKPKVKFEQSHQKVPIHPSQCMKDIFEWIEGKYAKLTFRILSSLDSKIFMLWPEKVKFKDIGISRLANFRSKQLFSIVENWPHNGEALDDLRTAITTPERRLHLTEVFAQTLARKVLHPAASTTKILQTYISMIWSFHSLDQSKVLLDKVAYPLQLYLYTREDTVRIILSGLLADLENSFSDKMGDQLLELAWLLNNESDVIGQKASEVGLDWHDMDWIPDPVDAGPTYKRSKNADIIGTLVGVLGCKEIFIKEFQNIIGDIFLKYNGEFLREIKVLELLKVKFGEAPLQACEVMLKDIQDSREIDSKIQELNKNRERVPGTTRNSQHLSRVEEDHSNPSLHAKILSRFFWPQLHFETLKIPPEIAELQKKYEEGFTFFKPSRKLTWLDTSGMATIEIELKDRTIVEEVHTWQAVVILAFQNDGIHEQYQRRTIQELLSSLQMEEGLVRSALKFWINKSVLCETSLDTYVVRETQSLQDQVYLDSQNSDFRSMRRRDQNIYENYEDTSTALHQNMEIYWQFIQAMLTNSSKQMPLQQIAMMLKSLIIDGFPHSNDELKEFLKQKITDGVLELSNGKYRLKK